MEQGTTLISNVQKLSQAERKERDIHTVEVKKLLEQAISDTETRFDKQEVSINTNYPQKAIKCKGGKLLIDAFENLLRNGILHNKSEEKKLWIDITHTEYERTPYIKIEFKDNGVGIPDKDKEKIFRRGVKTEHSSGMGIGLSLVKEIIEGYNGAVWVENRVESDYKKGSNFIVLLEES
jgi:signal transduction histidine kinase